MGVGVLLVKSTEGNENHLLETGVKVAKSLADEILVFCGR
jgi:hypothetical protein